MDDLVLSLTTAAGQLTTTLNGRPLAQTPRATLSPTSTAEVGGADLYEKLSRSADPFLWLERDGQSLVGRAIDLHEKTCDSVQEMLDAGRLGMPFRTQ